MPVREPKARLLVREYMADYEFMTAFNAAEREWYMLAALHADDAGYLGWHPEELAGTLYRYERRQAREAKVRAFAAKFAANDRLVFLDCGRHAFMPKVAKRPRGGRPSYVDREEHETECIGIAVGPDKPRSTANDSDRSPVNQSSPFPSFPFRVQTGDRSQQNSSAGGGLTAVGEIAATGQPSREEETTGERRERLERTANDPTLSPTMRGRAQDELRRLDAEGT